MPSPLRSEDLFAGNLDDVLPLLDAIEFAIQDWVEARGRRSADMILVWSGLLAATAATATGVSLPRATRALSPSDIVHPVIALLAGKLSLKMAKRRGQPLPSWMERKKKNEEGD